MAGINMQQLMKQAQQMQQKLAEAQESMNEVAVDASAGPMEHPPACRGRNE